jgi:hypothetical protein
MTEFLELKTAAYNLANLYHNQRTVENKMAPATLHDQLMALTRLINPDIDTYG